MAGVFVVGSINQDFVLRVERRPEPGETVTDAELSLLPGGKGANGAGPSQPPVSGPKWRCSGASAKTLSARSSSKT